MLVTLTPDQMLERRRLAAGLEPLRADCAIELTEGLNLRRMHLAEIRVGYLNLLDTADPALLPTADIAPLCDAALQPDGSAIVSLPQNCRRLLSLKLNGWKRPAGITPWSEGARRLADAANPYCQPGPDTPLAVALPDGTVAAMPGRVEGVIGCSVVSALAVTDPGEELYIIDEALLPTTKDLKPLI